MTNFLLFIIICYLYCINEKLKKPKKDKKKDVSIQNLLPTYVGKTCEISFNTFKTPVIGILRDIDDEWIVLDCFTEKSNFKQVRKDDQQTVTKIFKISIIADVKAGQSQEIIDTTKAIERIMNLIYYDNILYSITKIQKMRI